MANCLANNPWFACLLDSQAFVSLVSVFVGFALGFVGTRYQEFARRRNERRSLASVLFIEVVSQAHWCQERGKRWNLFEAADSMKLRLLRSDRPPEPEVYKAVADKLGFLPPTSASRIVAFHGAVAALRSRIDAWAGEPDFYKLVDADRRDLATMWRAACFNGVLAIRSLEPLARIPKLANDEEMLSRLKRDLAGVAEDEWITQDRADATTDPTDTGE